MRSSPRVNVGSSPSDKVRSEKPFVLESFRMSLFIIGMRILDLSTCGRIAMSRPRRRPRRYVRAFIILHISLYSIVAMINSTCHKRQAKSSRNDSKVAKFWVLSPQLSAAMQHLLDVHYRLNSHCFEATGVGRGTVGNVSCGHEGSHTDRFRRQ